MMPSRGRGPRWLAGYVAHPEDGPLPAMLLLLTVSTGLVDAVSILALGRVFVANMTGNIVFIGFALAGAPGFSLQASLVALAAFLVGAGLGGRLSTRFGHHRGLLLRNAVWLELAMLVAATVVLDVAGPPYSAYAQDLAVGLTAAALGVQNAAVRSLAVPDLTTTVLTMTLTGVAADLHKHNFRVAVRRLLAVAAMLVGAVSGALLTEHVSATWALALASLLIAVAGVTLTARSRRTAAWHRT